MAITFSEMNNLINTSEDERLAGLRSIWAERAKAEPEVPQSTGVPVKLPKIGAIPPPMADLPIPSPQPIAEPGWGQEGGIAGFAKNLMTGVQLGIVNEVEAFDNIAQWVAKQTGMDKPTILKSIKEKVQPSDEALMDQSLAAKVARGIGAAIPMIAEFAASGPILGAATKAAKIPTVLKLGSTALTQGKRLLTAEELAKGGEIALQAGKLGTKVGGLLPLTEPLMFAGYEAGHEAFRPGATLGSTLEAAGKGTLLGTALPFGRMLPRVAREAAPAGIFGGMAALEGAPTEDVVASTLVGAVFGLTPALGTGAGKMIDYLQKKKVAESPLPTRAPTEDIAVTHNNLNDMLKSLGYSGYENWKLNQKFKILDLKRVPPENVSYDPKTGEVSYRYGKGKKEVYVIKPDALEEALTTEKSPDIKKEAVSSTGKDFGNFISQTDADQRAELVKRMVEIYQNGGDLKGLFPTDKLVNVEKAVETKDWNNLQDTLSNYVNSMFTRAQAAERGQFYNFGRLVIDKHHKVMEKPGQAGFDIVSKVQDLFDPKKRDSLTVSELSAIENAGSEVVSPDASIVAKKIRQKKIAKRDANELEAAKLVDPNASVTETVAALNKGNAKYSAALKSMMEENLVKKAKKGELPGGSIEANDFLDFWQERFKPEGFATREEAINSLYEFLAFLKKNNLKVNDAKFKKADLSYKDLHNWMFDPNAPDINANLKSVLEGILRESESSVPRSPVLESTSPTKEAELKGQSPEFTLEKALTTWDNYKSTNDFIKKEFNKPKEQRHEKLKEMASTIQLLKEKIAGFFGVAGEKGITDDEIDIRFGELAAEPGSSFQLVTQNSKEPKPYRFLGDKEREIRINSIKGWSPDVLHKLDDASIIRILSSNVRQDSLQDFPKTINELNGYPINRINQRPIQIDLRRILQIPDETLTTSTGEKVLDNSRRINELKKYFKTKGLSDDDLAAIDWNVMDKWYRSGEDASSLRSQKTGSIDINQELLEKTLSTPEEYAEYNVLRKGTEGTYRQVGGELEDPYMYILSKVLIDGMYRNAAIRQYQVATGVSRRGGKFEYDDVDPKTGKKVTKVWIPPEPVEREIRETMPKESATTLEGNKPSKLSLAESLRGMSKQFSPLPDGAFIGKPPEKESRVVTNVNRTAGQKEKAAEAMAAHREMIKDMVDERVYLTDEDLAAGRDFPSEFSWYLKKHPIRINKNLPESEKIAMAKRIYDTRLAEWRAIQEKEVIPRSPEGLDTYLRNRFGVEVVDRYNDLKQGLYKNKTMNETLVEAVDQIFTEKWQENVLTQPKAERVGEVKVEGKKSTHPGYEESKEGRIPTARGFKAISQVKDALVKQGEFRKEDLDKLAPKDLTKLYNDIIVKGSLESPKMEGHHKMPIAGRAINPQTGEVIYASDLYLSDWETGWKNIVDIPSSEHRKITTKQAKERKGVPRSPVLEPVSPETKELPPEARLVEEAKVRIEKAKTTFKPVDVGPDIDSIVSEASGRGPLKTNMEALFGNLKVRMGEVDKLKTTLDKLRADASAEKDQVKKNDMNAKITELDSQWRNARAGADLLQKTVNYQATLVPQGRGTFIERFLTKDANGMQATVVSDLKGVKGNTFYLVQDSKGGFADPAGGNSVVAEVEVLPKGKGKDSRMEIVFWDETRSLPPEAQDALYSAVVDRFMYGKQRMAQIVVPAEGVAQAIYKRRMDVNYANAPHFAKDLPKEAQQEIMRRRFELDKLQREAADRLVASGTPQSRTVKMGNKFVTLPTISTMEAKKMLYESMMALGDESVDARLVNKRLYPELMNPLEAAEYDKLTWMPLADWMGDPSQSRVLPVARVGNYALQTDTQIKYLTKLYLERMNEKLGWLKGDKEASEAAMRHLQAEGLKRKGKSAPSNWTSTDPKILQVAKDYRAIMEDMASLFNLKEKGLYEPDYATIQYDFNKMWKKYGDVIKLANMPSDLPNDMFYRLQLGNGQGLHWEDLKRIADSGKDYDSLDAKDKSILKQRFFKWNLAYDSWNELPDFVRRMIPKEKFNVHFQHRTAELMQEFLKENLWDVGTRYVLSTVHDGVVNDFFLPRARDIAKVIPDYGINSKLTTRGYLDAYIKQVAGFAPEGPLTTLANKAFTQNAQELWVQSIYRGALGIDTALRNLTQSMYTIADVGVSPFLKGTKNYVIGRITNSPEYVKWENRMDLVQEFYNDKMRLLKGGMSRTTWEHIMDANRKVTSLALTPLGITERINKGIAYFSGLERAKELGMDFQTAHIIGLKQATAMATPLQFSQAEWFAWRKQFGSQFGYSEAQRSPIFAGPGMQFFTPFWSFPMKSFQFVANLFKDAYGLEKIPLTTLQVPKLVGTSMAQKMGYKAEAPTDAQANAALFRFLALTGFMVSAPTIMAETLGIDVGYLWGIKGMLPTHILPAWMDGINDLFMSMGAPVSSVFGELPPTYVERERAWNNFSKFAYMMLVPQYRYYGKVRDAYERLDKGYYTMGSDKLPSQETSMGIEIANLFGWPPYRKDTQEAVYGALRVNRDYYSMRHDMIQQANEEMEKGNYEKAAANLKRFYDKYGVPIQEHELREYRRSRDRENIFERSLKVIAKNFKPQFAKELTDAERKAMPRDIKSRQRSMWMGVKTEEEIED